MEQALASIESRWPLDDFWFFHRSVLHQMQGRPEMARKCLEVAHDRCRPVYLEPEQREWGPRLIHDANRWSCQHLGLSRTWQATDPPPDDLIPTYTDLLATYPDCPSLYFGRGVNWARANNWEAASQDFSTARELRPDLFIYWEALAIAQLQQQNPDAVLQLVPKNLARFAYDQPFASRCLLLCALSPESGISRDAMRDRLRTFSTKEPIGHLAEALAYYRLGDYQRALDSLPSKDDKFTSCVGPLIQAMAHQQLGDPVAAAMSWVEAQQQIEELKSSATWLPIGKFEIPERVLCRAIMERLSAEAKLLIRLPNRPA